MMSYEEFKLAYCYDLPKVQFEMYEKSFKMKYCYKENLLEYPEETPRMQYDKFKYIDDQYQKYQEDILPKVKFEIKDYNKEFMEFLIEWIQSMNKKYQRGELS